MTARKFAIVMAVCLGTAGSLTAQRTVPTPQGQSTAPAAPAVQKALLTPTDSDIYCAGFFTHRDIEPDLFVLGSEDGALKYEYGAGDIIYLNKGRKGLGDPGGMYMLVRPVKDVVPVELFPGQQKLVARLGTMYAEIARIEVLSLNEGSATAQITNSCEAVLGGDIAIPLSRRPAPPYKTARITDRFAPASGKSAGMIAAIKEFQQAAGAGQIVYLNLGTKEGAQVGDYLRIFRSYRSASQDIAMYGMQNYLTEMMGVPLGHKLTRQEQQSIPRVVLGEVMILSAEEETSTGIITYSFEDVYLGDEVEVE